MTYEVKFGTPFSTTFSNQKDYIVVNAYLKRTDKDGNSLCCWVGDLIVTQRGKASYYAKYHQPYNLLLELGMSHAKGTDTTLIIEQSIDCLIEYHTQMVKALTNLKKEDFAPS